MTGPQGFDYGRLMQRALRGLMVEVLGQVAEEGLPGEHHFYISLDTTHPGVDMPDWLRERHPEEITIVIQHEYDDLAVMSDRFSIRLSFSDRSATLVVPFDAVLTFVDPSMEFGLKFDGHEAEDDDDVSEPEADGADDEAAPETPKSDEGAEVVSLDTFRKH
ncbi:MAG: ClpXP protease specificity-enhancing factor SspB [Pseudomonadota bacterium]